MKISADLSASLLSPPPSLLSPPTSLSFSLYARRAARGGAVAAARRLDCLLLPPLRRRCGRRSFSGENQLSIQRLRRLPGRRQLGPAAALPSHFILELTSSQIASGTFKWATVSVLPFYALMVLAPKSKLTRRIMESNIPYAILGFVYAYLVYLSWTPDSLKLLFPNKYFLPELAGVAKMFSSEMTLASVWAHLLAVDLYAARQVYRDGREKVIETRHSVVLCLFCCPVGVAVHVITKALTQVLRKPLEEQLKEN